MNSSADKPSHLSDPTALVELFNLGQAESPLPWNTNDLAAILRHQLHQPLGPLPGKADDGIATRPHLDLFTETSPPLDRLRRVKDQAKAGSNQDDDLPRDVATVMYYAALAAARLHHPDESITRLDDEAFRVGLDWALQLPWLDPALKPLFSQAYDSAHGGGDLSEHDPTQPPTPPATPEISDDDLEVTRDDTPRPTPPRPEMSAADETVDTPGDPSRRSRSHGSLPPLPAPPADAPTVPGYHLLHKLGEGGMGVVWKAVQLATRREVALKLLSAAAFGSDTARQRFQREVELAARLEHPFIARVYDSSSATSSAAPGVVYYAMELVPGLDLETHVRSQGLKPKAILRLMRDVCLGVQHAHQRGVIHRDLKPSNILVVPGDSNLSATKPRAERSEAPDTTPSQGPSQSTQPTPKIVDFGLAKTTTPEDGQVTLSHVGQVAGTPAYMSPEQAAGKTDAIDTRTDVYALGVILYRLLTGKYPHDTSVSFTDLLRHITEDEVVRPRAASEDASKIIDRELETLLLKALDKDPDRRYDNAGALAADMDNYLNDLPLIAKVPTTGYVIRKQLHRHRKAVAVAGVVGLLMLGGVGAGIGWLYQRPYKLRVDSNPAGGLLRINDVLKPGCGVTPCYVKLPRGKHKIEVVLPNHYQPEPRYVEIEWGQPVMNVAEPLALQPDFRAVMFTTEPVHARVQIRKEDTGEVVTTLNTPGLTELPHGRYTMHFANSDGEFDTKGETLAIAGSFKPLKVHRPLE